MFVNTKATLAKTAIDFYDNLELPEWMIHKNITLGPYQALSFLHIFKEILYDEESHTLTLGPQFDELNDIEV